MPRCFPCVVVIGAALLVAFSTSRAEEAAVPEAWDTYSDTWVATDALGRRVPTAAEVGPPRVDRTVGIFYFLWHGQHVQGGPYDIRKILAQDPEAMQKKDCPLWGPMYAPHHWGESIFGYYLSDDAGVLRKHAQMLSDAGVDAVIFDVTNQHTYRPYYQALLRVFSEVRRDGGHPPQVIFLCPFGDPDRVVAELYRELYEPGLWADLWFRWDGKPLILADPERLRHIKTYDQHDQAAELTAGHTLGQSVTAETPVTALGVHVATFETDSSAVMLTVSREGLQGERERLASRRFENVKDNGWLLLELEQPAPAGKFYLELSEPTGQIGWWSHSRDALSQGEAFSDGKVTAGGRTVRVLWPDPKEDEIRQFFTFRAPQPDYFKGPTKPDMWSWLEVYPQHVFVNSRSEKEEMSVGVAQNGVGRRLGSMSEPGARGRSFQEGVSTPPPEALLRGANVAQQWERALQEDPRFVFLTGWNEWFAGRYDEFNHVRMPVMFVDQFDQEHSRDIEPMKGGHGDNYYYQMVSYIRRYKGARTLPPVVSRSIAIDGRFDDWAEVSPEFRDTIGDPVHRDHSGWGSAGPYVDQSGRNDLVAAKASLDAEQVSFYIRTREPLTPHTDANWMVLLLDVDHDPATGWLGYDYVVNRLPATAETVTLERYEGENRWGTPVQVPYRMAGNELELSIPRKALGATALEAIDFKWLDNAGPLEDPIAFTLHGDAAPNDRFNYRAVFAQP